MATESPWQELIGRIANDPEMRALALSDPVESIKRATGREVPAGVVLRVIEDGGRFNLSIAADAEGFPEASLSEMAGPDSAMACCHIPNALQISCV